MRGRAPALGCVVPPANPTVEPELRELLGSALRVDVARLPVISGPLRARLEQYNTSLPATIAAFSALAPDAVAVACTGSSYLLGVDGDRSLRHELTAASGVPVMTAAAAVLRALAKLGVGRVILASPYPDWLTASSRAFWEEAGLTVPAVIECAAGTPIYELRADDVTARVRAGLEMLPVRGGEALLFTGTGMPTLGPMAALASWFSGPIVSSNLCLAWWAAHTAGVVPTSAALVRRPDRPEGVTRPR